MNNNKGPIHPLFSFVFVAILCVLIAIFAVSKGSVEIPFKAVIEIILGLSHDHPQSMVNIVLQIRLPRVILALGQVLL